MIKKRRLLVLALAASVLFVVFFVFKLVDTRSEMYPYDVHKDYSYQFDHSHAVFSSVPLENGRLQLPNAEGSFALYMKAEVTSSWLGKLFQPFLEIESKGVSSRQYFEYGAEGERYINLTPFVEKQSAEVNLKGHHVAIKSKNIELIALKKPDIEDKRIMVLAPHPDDAEIAAYGLYSDSKNAYIVTITAGEAGEFKYNELYTDPKKHYLKKGVLRTWDSIVNPMLGGVPPERCVNLGYFDSTLLEMYQNPTVSVKGVYTGLTDPRVFRMLNVSKLAAGLAGGANWQSLVDNLKYLLSEIKPDIIVTVYPSLDSHPDHKFTTVAVIEALKSLDIHAGKLFLYSNHYVLSEFYPYGQIGGLMSLPPNFDKAVYFDGLYPYTLTHNKQMDKILAFEAMHDLRLDTEWLTVQGAMHWALRSLKKSISNKDWENYYKRYVRNNEQFFVVDIAHVYNDEVLNALYGGDVFSLERSSGNRFVY